MLCVDVAALAFPGTASALWRDEIAASLDRARVWMHPAELRVVLVGRDRLAPHTHDALHRWNVDAAIFSGSRTAPDLGVVSAVAIHWNENPADVVWILSPSLAGRHRSVVTDRLSKLGMRARVRVLPVRDDVLTPFVADDLDELFSDFVRGEL